MNLTINNVTIELNKDTITQIKKAIEEFEKSDEIRPGNYWVKGWNSYNGDVDEEIVIIKRYLEDVVFIEHLLDVDEIIPEKNYTKDQAKEYFKKRDARRAAETKLREIISRLNKKDGFVAKFDGTQQNCFSYIDCIKDKLEYAIYSSNQHLELFRYSSKETAQFINENHADLLKAYLNG